MNIALRNIKYSPHLSEDSNAFSASLYIDGKHAGFVKNQGMGGPTDYIGKDEEGAILIKEAEKYCENLPPLDVSEHHQDGKEHFLKMDLELFISELLEKHLDERESKKMARLMEKGFIVGIPDKSYTVYSYKNASIKEYLQHPNGPEIIQKLLKRDILAKLTGNRILHNTNIPEKLLKDAGLTMDQYRKDLIQTKQQEINANKKSGKRI